MPFTQFPASVDVSTLTGGNKGFIITGFPASALAGYSVSDAGDLNNDGIADLCIGAVGNTGGSYIIFGKSGVGSSGSLSVSTLTGSNGFVITGFQASSFAGDSVSDVGDLNNDGITDLVIGAPSYTSGPAGICYVIFGKSNIGSSGTLNVASLTGSTGFTITGFPAGSQGDFSISDAGDLNNDGIADLVVGAPQASSSTGICYVIFGKSGIGSSGTLSVASLTGSNGFSITGFAAGSLGGSSASNAGDLNNDGIADLVVGARGGSGASYVIFGKSGIGSSGTLSVSTLTGSNGFVITGFPVNSQGGSSVSGVGDFNGDGIADLIVGAPSTPATCYVIFGKSSIGSSGALDISTLTGNNGFVITGFPPASEGGSSASGLGDLNGDGIADLIVGAYAFDSGTGKSYVIFGKSGIGSSGILDLSSLTVSDGFAITGFSDASNGGFSVSSAGDLNNNGNADLIVGARHAFANSGTSYVIFGDIVSSLSNNRLTITKGQTTLLTDSYLNATYPGRSALDPTLPYTLSSIQHGFFTLTSSPFNAITSFQQQQVRNNQVQFTHDNTGFPPSYNVQLLGAGGLMTMAPQPASITFVHQGGVLVNNQLAISQGQTVTLFSTQLSANNLDIASDNPTLIFLLSNIQHGYFQQAGNPGIAVTSFTQSQLQVGSIQFVHDGSNQAPSYSVAVSDGSITTTPAASNIAFNLAPTLGNNSLSLNQGQTVILTSSMLSASDPDNASPSLQFIMSNVQRGHFELVGSPGAAITSFTQGQVQAAAVQFVSDGSVFPPSYSVAVSDGKIATSFLPSTITFNKAPVLNINTLTVKQGQAVILTSGMLSATDPDDAAAGLSFIASNLQHGQFELVAAPGAAITSFNQAQVQAGAVQFVPDGSSTAPSFNIAVSDGKMTIPSSACSVSFDASPVLTVNSLSLSQGQTVLLSPANLVAIDPDNTPASLTFMVSNVLNGHFQRLSSPGVAITSFTQGELQNSVIQFVSDGSSTAPSYRIAVSDGIITTTPQISTVSFNVAPTLVNNKLTVNQGQSIILTSSMLSATDPDNAAADLIFAVTGVQYGHFESITNKGVVISSFTQAEIQNGQIQFIADGSGNTPQFSVAVSDGKIATAAQFATVTFNVAPILLNNALTVQQGQTVILTNEHFSASASSTSTSITFIFTNVVGGQFELISAPGAAITSFTQAQIQSGAVQFVQDGSTTVPKYNIAISDGFIPINPTQSSIIFNAAPTLNKNQLAITDGGSHIMTPDDLSAMDDHTPVADLVFTASGVSRGQFEDLSLPGTPLTLFAQQKINAGALRFVSDGSGIAPQYNVSVSDGSLSTAPSNAIVNFSPRIAALTAEGNDNTVRNAVIGGTVSGAIGLLFLGVKFGITNKANRYLTKALDEETDSEQQLAEFQRKIIRPLVNKIFDRIKTTEFMGYRAEEDTKAFITAIEHLLTRLGKAGVDLEKETETGIGQSRLFNEIVRQTRKVLIPEYSYCSTTYLASFFTAEITPKQIEDNADAIVRAVALALDNPTNASISPHSQTRQAMRNSPQADASDIELQDVKTPVESGSLGRDERTQLLEKQMSSVDARLEVMGSRFNSIETSIQTLTEIVQQGQVPGNSRKSKAKSRD